MKTPNVNVSAGAILALFAIGAVAFLYFWNRKSIASGVKSVVNAVNPVSDTNLAYKGASKVTSVLTGSNDSLGGTLAEWFSPSVRAANAMLNSPIKTVVTPAATVPLSATDISSVGDYAGTFDPYAVNPRMRN